MDLSNLIKFYPKKDKFYYIFSFKKIQLRIKYGQKHLVLWEIYFLKDDIALVYKHRNIRMLQSV